MQKAVKFVKPVFSKNFKMCSMYEWRYRLHIYIYIWLNINGNIVKVLWSVWFFFLNTWFSLSCLASLYEFFGPCSKFFSVYEFLVRVRIFGPCQHPFPYSCDKRKKKEKRIKAKLERETREKRIAKKRTGSVHSPLISMINKGESPSQTRAKCAYLVTLETKMNTPTKYYHTYKRINK